MEKRTREEIFEKGNRTMYMSFEEMLIIFNTESAKQIGQTKQFKEDKMFEFEIAINGVPISLKEFENYLDKKYVQAETSLKYGREQLNKDQKNLNELIEGKAKILAKETIEDMFYKMHNSMTDIEEKLTTNSENYNYYWDEKKRGVK